jgi:hypothetical protein
LAIEDKIIGLAIHRLGFFNSCYNYAFVICPPYLAVIYAIAVFFDTQSPPKTLVATLNRPLDKNMRNSIKQQYFIKSKNKGYPAPRKAISYGSHEIGSSSLSTL